jgi:hypothetical protein
MRSKNFKKRKSIKRVRSRVYGGHTAIPRALADFDDDLKGQIKKFIYRNADKYVYYDWLKGMDITFLPSTIKELKNFVQDYLGTNMSDTEFVNYINAINETSFIDDRTGNIIIFKEKSSKGVLGFFKTRNYANL